MGNLEWTGTIGPISGGVSAAYTGKACLEHAQDEAISALTLGERLRGPGFLTAYGDVLPLDYATRTWWKTITCATSTTR